MQYINFCNFTTAEPSAVAVTTAEPLQLELPEEEEGTQESRYSSDQPYGKSGEISPSSTQQSCGCKCSEMKEQLDDLQKKVDFLLKQIKKPSSPKSAPERRPPGSTQKGEHVKKNLLTMTLCGNYSFTFTLLT